MHFIACSQDLKMLKYTPNCTRWKSQSAWLYTSNYAHKTLSSILPSIILHALQIPLNGTPPVCLTVCSRITAQDPLKYTASKCAPKYSLLIQATSDFTCLHAPMYAPGCLMQRLNELPVPHTRGQVVRDGSWQPQSWRLSKLLSKPSFQLGHLEEISRYLMVMVLKIEAWNSAGKVDNWI
jgi:hypothetical protein